MSKIKNVDLIKVPKTQSNETEENSLESFIKTEQYIRRNRVIVGIIAGLIVAVIAGYFIYNYMRSSQEREAQEQMFAAVYWWQAEDYKKSINGDGNYLGFEAIIKNYPLSKAANMAYFYSGVAHLKEKKFKEAIDRLRKFSGSDWLVQARSYSLIGDAHLELNQFEEAVTNYERAVSYKPNKQFTPAYMMKLALAYEKAKKNEQALKVYEKVIAEYPNTNEYFNAKKYQARLETLLGK
ncbi:MAG: tetratricopeptide repeat protein [Cytophagia bacterium]|nr:MAG: tetratricopeptide repeat protein [Cytophagales bacterium]TAG05617.1 MAG: tetratricopeptide repeat protein [Cytophagia bacterium]TAG44016.1 MAG: tetratricopeptide repeat protein [Cytophagia bacterium]TAH30978.1 MAG: tetratricopeptide repeat protein [Cytophagales bacterium]